MNNTTQLEQVLAKELAKVANVDIEAIIIAAQRACMGGCKTVASENATVVVSPVKEEKSKAVKLPVQEAAPDKSTNAYDPNATQVNQTMPEKLQPPKPEPTVGIDLSGLFTGSGADRKVVKDVFLAAVEKAKSLAALTALNATCDCGFDLSAYTDDTVEVVRRKLRRWGAAQE